MIGAAWRGLATELEEALREEDPSARVIPWVDADGSLRFKVAVERGRRSAARATVRRFEARAATVCETCGGEVRQTRSAAGMAVYLCPDCVPD